MAKFKCEVIRCAEEKGNCKASAIFGVDESNINCDRNTRQRSVGVRRHEGNSLDPRKDDFLKLMMQSSRFFKRVLIFYGTCLCVCAQGVSGGIVNILRGGSMTILST
jgi:hypothetical protein